MKRINQRNVAWEIGWSPIFKEESTSIYKYAEKAMDFNVTVPNQDHIKVTEFQKEVD